MLINELRDHEIDGLIEGLRHIDQRQTKSDALMVGSLLATYLRLLGKEDEAQQVLTIVRNLHV